MKMKTYLAKANVRLALMSVVAAVLTVSAWAQPIDMYYNCRDDFGFDWPLAARCDTSCGCTLQCDCSFTECWDTSYINYPCTAQ